MLPSTPHLTRPSMSPKLIAWFALLAGVLVFTAPFSSSAWACACCVVPGQRVAAEQPYGPFSREIVDSVTFGKSANLFAPDAIWSEEINGISNPAKSTAYTLHVTREKKQLVFAFSDAKGNTGTLTFRFPFKMFKFAVDPRPEVGPDSKDRELYKEWRFSGEISGTGMFDFRGLVSATLIFQGRGNGCPWAKQFTNWTLDADGRRARFRFFGRLDTSGS